MFELAVNDLISVQQAIDILDSTPVQPRVIQVPLIDSLGRYLAEDIHADRDYPPFDKAVMDGYAIRAGGGTQFKIIQTVMAGEVPDQPIEAGQAMAIMTGAPVPGGADTVIPIEWTSRQGELVTIHRAVIPGNAIARRASDSVVGRLLLTAGTKIASPQIAMLASVGKPNVWIYAAPLVSLISTGDELVSIEKNPAGSQIRNSNGPMMTALLTQLGCVVQDLGIVKDKPDLIRHAVEHGLRSDILFITGGMSMGEHDYVPALLKELGLEMRISKLRIKPGKPFVFATGCSKDGTRPQLVFGLPGNPVSGYVCTVVLANRILSRLIGRAEMPASTTAQLTQAMPANGPREFYLPARRIGSMVIPLKPNGSADLATLSQADCLIIRPENSPAAQIGDQTAVIILP